jgi:hypothetical protein
MPDFGIFRGFNEKLFGNKLYAGQLPINLGLIGSESFGADPDALAFFARVTAAGGILSATEQLAINTLVVQMKADGIWTKMKAVYPMVGGGTGTLAQRQGACAQNLKSSSFTGTFSATGWTFASTGVTSDGFSAFMDTGLNANNNLTTSNAHFSIYVRTHILSGDAINGVYPGIFIDQVSGKYFYGIGVQIEIFVVSSLGMSQINALSPNMQLFKNGVSLNSILSGGSLPNANLNLGRSGAGTPYYWNGTLAFSSIGDGLTDPQAGLFYTAVQAFQTTLGRAV